MNKKDLLLIAIILIISSLMLLLFSNNKSGNYAYVYYENDIVKKIDLSINSTYTVEGYNGFVVIEVLDSKIRVVEENSKNHICSNMGFVSSSLEPIICLPNKIVIKIVEQTDIDAVVR